MIKITKDQIINEDMIESICEYNSEALRRQAKIARENNCLREFQSGKGYKTIIIFEDNVKMLAPLYPDRYMNRIADKDSFLIADPKRYMLRKDYIREICTKPNEQQKRDIKNAKDANNYINLTKGKKVQYYIFMKTGKIYGLHLIKEDLFEKGGEEDEE